MIGQPLVLLADEPISHQNHEWAEVMMQVLADLATAGTTCLLATHNELAFAARAPSPRAPRRPAATLLTDSCSLS